MRHWRYGNTSVLVFITHTGFDPALVEQAASVLKANGVGADPQALLTLPGFCELRRHLDALPTQFLDSRIRRFQTFAEISTVPVRILAWGLKPMPPGHLNP